jgi:hypothetical protein
MKQLLIALFFLVFPLNLWASEQPAVTANKEYSGWIQQMKKQPRGPFKNVMWFCNDGSVLPPKAYACREHGGGKQHGNYTDKTRILRENGYYIANILAAFDVPEVIQEPGFIDQYNQILIEKFLMQIDDGWIMREAQFYRGAIQEENERDRARALLTALIAEDEWITYRFLGLYSGVRLLAHGKDTPSAQKVRQMAASLAEKDKGFTKLRVKIHGSPGAGDADLVRKYAESVTDNSQYLQLADEIDLLYQAPDLSDLLLAQAKVYTAAPWLQEWLTDTAESLQQDSSPENQYALTAQALADIRDFLPRVKSASARLGLLDLSLTIEAVNFKNSTQLRDKLQQMTRAQRLKLLEQAALAAYGTGVINSRSYQQLEASIAKLQNNEVVLTDYLQELGYLGRVPGWGTQGMRFQFYASMQKLGEIEPLTYHFIQDQLRGGPLLFFSQVLNGLTFDANQLSGVKHSLFGEKIGVGFQALNPGLVRGTLYTDMSIENIASIQPDGIYVLPETVSDLPPLAGIITAGEGNPLSHVQLLARNLGIPNVTVNEEVIPKLQKHNGEVVVMAVSPSGLVEISEDSEKWREFFDAGKSSEDIVIRPDLEKLDIQFDEFVDLTQLRAEDSGRIVGPKAAKLGELKYLYPDKVANGVAIPFGIFHETVLAKPYKNSSTTIFDWMVEQYAYLSSLESDPVKHQLATEAFRAELYDIIITAKLDASFVEGLQKSLEKTFGSTELGVFVRSDTNVEDLPGFTGAGLNLTMPNVMGLENLLQAINKVWASPFTKRAFAWRQSHMEKPQYVYPSILMLRSVANEKSGVMVTADIDTGSQDILSVAVNEGVGGAVDGQSAESLRINRGNGLVRVLATATAPTRRQPSAEGGLVKLPVSGAETILQPEEIKQLIQFANELPEKFPSIVDDQGKPAPADVEFGFVKGELQLFQIRPFLDNNSIQDTLYLMDMDKALQSISNINVDLNGIPGK